MSPFYIPGAQKLGEVTLGSGSTDIGPIFFGPGWGVIVAEAYIAGYSASQIAMWRVGIGATVDTGTNYSCFTNSLTTTATAGTSRATQSGVQVSNVAQTNARRHVAVITNSSARPTVITSHGVDYSAQNPTAGSAMANNAVVNGAWFNNAQAQCIGLNSGGAGTLLTGSAIAVWGIPG